mmetsp:Transcript_72682/g.160488  ORF Transcript_72682/g.160488 Transcript_72682/m.160488 type:complete len:238 (+) Transcript_72682:626-1339(+)
MIAQPEPPGPASVTASEAVVFVLSCSALALPVVAMVPPVLAPVAAQVAGWVLLVQMVQMPRMPRMASTAQIAPLAPVTGWAAPVPVAAVPVVPVLVPVPVVPVHVAQVGPLGSLGLLAPARVLLWNQLVPHSRFLAFVAQVHGLSPPSFGLEGVLGGVSYASAWSPRCLRLCLHLRQVLFPAQPCRPIEQSGAQLAFVWGQPVSPWSLQPLCSVVAGVGVRAQALVRPPRHLKPPAS